MDIVMPTLRVKLFVHRALGIHSVLIKDLGIDLVFDVEEGGSNHPPQLHLTHRREVGVELPLKTVAWRTEGREIRAAGKDEST